MKLEKIERQALELQGQGRDKDAKRLFLQILKSRPSHFLALYSLGCIAARARELETAFGYFDRAVKADPESAPTWYSRGLMLQHLLRTEEALASLERALALDPTDFKTIYCLSVCESRCGNHSEALAYLDRCIAANPRHAESWYNRGVVLQALKRRLDAIECFGKALDLNGEYASALLNRGAEFGTLYRHAEALADYDRLLQLQPDNATALANRGIILGEANRHEESVAAFQKLILSHPEYNYAWGLLYTAQLYICQWDRLDEYYDRISQGIALGNRVCKTHPLLAISDSSKDHLRCARIFADQWAPPRENSWPAQSSRHEKIRLAYVSPDLREHPVGHLMAGIFENHDKSRFETTAIYLGLDVHSSLHKRISAAFDRFVYAGQMSTLELAQLMRSLEIDVVVDLAGYTADSRCDLFTYRPAPIQVNYLGYPSTMGMECFDYVIADRCVIPEENHPYFSEKVVYLPDTYLPTDETLKVAEQTPSREAFGLPAAGAVFCSFNHSYKISPAIFEIWMRILKRVPGSVLWLMKLTPAAEVNLRREAESRGVDPERLIFAERVPKVEDHLARYRLADLFLDTTPYNAHTTASDALFVGLPVLTCLGKAFPGRVASSLLQAIGLPELIADSLQAYEDLAVKLASDGALLAGVKRKLAANRGTHPLFDTKRYCRNLESAFVSMWEREQRGELPESFAVSGEPAAAAAGDRAAEVPEVPEVPEAGLGKARELFRQGNLPQAEIYARRCLARNASDAGARSLLEELRRGYGISDSFELSERNPAAADSGSRFLLVKAWGYGFWSEVHHLASALLLAELTRRTPIVTWGSNCLFRNDSDGNAFGHFFREISPARLEDVPRSEAIYPAKWSWDNLHRENVDKWEGEGSRLAAQYLFDRPEPLLVSDFFSTIGSIVPWIGPSSKYYGLSDDALYAEIFRKYLKPADGIVSRATDFYAGNMQGRNWVGVHVRGSDKIYESPHLAQTNAHYFSFVDRIVKLNPEIGVFLLTDSAPVIEGFRKRYGSRLLCTQATRSASDVGVHYMSNQDGVALGEEVLLDALLALKCDYFVGNKESNVSVAVAGMGDWRQGFIFLLGEKDIRGENLFLHRRRQDGAAQAAPESAKPASGPASEAESAPRCRLCKSPTAAAFSGKSLSKPIDYFKCSGCGSLQTESPWRPEQACAQKAGQFDPGKASRTLMNFLVMRRIFEILGIGRADRCADLGGGTGLFARLMRDIGYNYFSCDEHGSGEFCAGYSWEKLDRPAKVVTVFECAGHFADPAGEWDAVFATGADYVIGTTGIYAGQGADWSQLSAGSGRQTFFYSADALGHVASKRGWHAYLLGGYFVMIRSPLSGPAGVALSELVGDFGSANADSLQAWLKSPFQFASVDNRRTLALARLRSSGVRIALDGVFFRFATGIPRLWKSLLAEWSANGFGEFVLVIDRGRTAPRFAGIGYVDVPQRTHAGPADQAMLQEICDREKITLFTSTYYTTPLRTPSVLMIPDMIPEVMGFDLGDQQWQEKHRAIRYCENYLAISRSSANDLRGFFPEIAPEQVVTAYCGTDFRTPSAEQVGGFKRRHGIVRPYFMISGVKSGYKNALLFFQAFARLGERRSEYAILCTNSPPFLEPEFQECVGDAMLHLLVLSDADLQCAYAGAAALAYPSRYEGFGLPVLEAMACSCPVITCRNSSIVEVAGDAAIYVDPDDVGAMQQALLAAQEEGTRGGLVAKGLLRAGGFTWRKMADEVEAALTRWAVD